MNRAKVVLFAAVVMSALMVLPLVGCAPGAPAKEKFVTFLSLSDLTGPGAGFVAPINEAMVYGFEDLNARGGADGVKVKMITVDTRYDVARTTSAYKRYRTEPKIGMCFIPITAGVRGLAPLLERDKHPAITPADGEFQAHIGWVFLAAPPYQDGCAATFDWIMADWKAKGKSGMPTVAHLSWDNPYGREPMRGGKEYADKLGIKVLPSEFFPMGAPDHTVWLTRIGRSGADYCIIGGVDPTQANIMRDAAKLGLTKTIQFVSEYWGLDQNTGVKLHPEACEGAVVCSVFLRGDECFNHPFAALWAKYAKRPATEIKAIALAGVGITLDFEQVIKIALKAVGYDKLDGEATYQAYQKLTGFSRQGAFGPCAYSPTSRRGSEMVRFYRVQSGKLIPITDWQKTPDAVSLYPDW